LIEDSSAYFVLKINNYIKSKSVSLMLKNIESVIK